MRCLVVGVSSPFFPGIFLSRKRLETQQKRLVLEKNDGWKEWGDITNPYELFECKLCDSNRVTDQGLAKAGPPAPRGGGGSGILGSIIHSKLWFFVCLNKIGNDLTIIFEYVTSICQLKLGELGRICAAIHEK